MAGDDPLFPAAIVEYFGQSLFGVAAETVEQARAAAAKATVVYEDLPALLTIDDAMAAESLLEPPYTMAKGDAAAAIATAPHAIEGRIEIGGQEHFYLEGQAALAVPGEDEDIAVPLFEPASERDPAHGRQGAGCAEPFGHGGSAPDGRRLRRQGKPGQSAGSRGSAGGARLTGRPAKCVYDRDDDMIITGKRHDFRIDYRVGFDESGRILGVEFDQALRCGMSWDLSGPIADRAMFHADNCYSLPNARITSYRCKTNTQSNTAFRGFGGPQGMVGMERAIDHIAATLGMDPATVRAINFYPHKDSEGDEGKIAPYGMVVEDCIIGDIWSELTEISDYTKRREEIPGLEPEKPGPEARHRHDAGEIRHLLHQHDAEPGRRAGPCLQ